MTLEDSIGRIEKNMGSVLCETRVVQQLRFVRFGDLTMIGGISWTSRKFEIVPIRRTFIVGKEHFGPSQAPSLPNGHGIRRFYLLVEVRETAPFKRIGGRMIQEQK